MGTLVSIAAASLASQSVRLTHWLCRSRYSLLRPAWVARYELSSGNKQAMDVRTNTFCAGGAPAGDGRYVTTGGTAALGYKSQDGGFALNIYDPATNTWEQNRHGMQTNRWYSSVEPMADGSVIIVGGQNAGGYVSTHRTNEPSYEFYPSKGEPVHMGILARTVPVNLYPLTFLMANGELFVQSGRQAILWNLDSTSEKVLPNIPDVPRPYPSSAGVAMMPMTPDNGYKQTILFCGGISLGRKAAWGALSGPAVSTTDKIASTSCQQIDPLGSGQWRASDALPEPRVMGMFVHLPDGSLFFGGGVKKGTAGYTASGKGPGRPVGQSLGDDPAYTVQIYNPQAPAGSRWRAYGSLLNPRLYHSSAMLLPDGAVLISGSNPNEDVTTAHWPTSYAVDKWYPPYYNMPRPSSDQLPTTLRHGGKSFAIDMAKAIAGMSIKSLDTAYVRIIRTGFSTHGVNWGQRSLQLKSQLSDDKRRLTVEGLPNNPNLFAPGPALIFLVVDGIPSQGVFAHIGPKGTPAAVANSMSEFENLQQVSDEPAVVSTGEGGGGEKQTSISKRCAKDMPDTELVQREHVWEAVASNVTVDALSG